MPEFFLELLSEEIPTRMQASACTDLRDLICNKLDSSGFNVTTSQTFVTPRRLVFIVPNLPVMQPQIYKERRGPRTSASHDSINAFLRVVSTTTDKIIIRETQHGNFYFAISEQESRPTIDLLKGIVESILVSFPWPKSMQWEETCASWVRPLRRILCLFDEKVVPVHFAGLRASNITSGHKFLSSTTFSVHRFAYYVSRLRQAYVILDQNERARYIRTQAEALAQISNLIVSIDNKLLTEVTGLVEWPVILIGNMDESLLDLPTEVLTTVMQAHQRYFSTLFPDGRLAPRFLIISDIVTRDGGKAVISGNEKVLKARLADAKFFWRQDREKSLQKWVKQLDKHIFHKKLGTLQEKVERLRSLAKNLAITAGADFNYVDRATCLAKADLMTSMVVEFPELQGTIGHYYAAYDRESTEVCTAIIEHYAPLGPGETCPSSLASVCVALADKIDTLVGFWSINETPTGSRDPFALRRASLGIIRLIIENKLRIKLLPLFATAYRYLSQSYTVTIPQNLHGFTSLVFNPYELLDFIYNRLKAHLRDNGIRPDLIAAVFAVREEDDLLQILARINALSNFLNTNNGTNLLVSYRRSMHIVRIAEEKNQTHYCGTVDEDLLTEDSECILYSCLLKTVHDSTEAIRAGRFNTAMEILSGLCKPIDVFFKHVKVNSMESHVRDNRLKLLSRIGAAIETIADFDKIEGL